MRLNDPILINYPVRIREVLLSIIIILVVLFYVAPRFLSEVSAQEATEDFIIETIDIPPPEDVVQQKPNRPAIPEPVDDDTDDEEIEEFEDTDFSKFGDDVEKRKRGNFRAFDEAPEMIRGKEIKLRYPPMAKSAGIEGTVALDFFIDINGDVTEVKVTKSTGTVLDQAAIDAVKKSKWKPARQRDKKVGVWIDQELTFKLN